MQVDKAREEEQQPEGSFLKETSNSDKEKAILAANPNLHWSDVMIQSDKSNLVNLRDVIQARLNKITAEYLARKDNMRPLSSNLTSGPANTGEMPKLAPLSPSVPANDSNAQIPETLREDVEDAEEEKQSNVGEDKHMNTDEVLLQYGPETISELGHLLKHSFKVFWDGSISLFKDTVSSSTNNKEFLNQLLDVRMHSDQHQEPPVTLIHGIETEMTLRDTLMRIKHE